MTKNREAEEIERLGNTLDEIVRMKLPGFVQAAKDQDIIVIHQDAFAMDYQYDDCLILGMAIKYAGRLGKEVHIIGKCRETMQ